MYNKADILAAIWAAPDKATGLHFEYKGGTWQSRQRLDGTDSNRRDKTILRRRNTDGQVFVNYNGGSFPAGQDIWQFLQWQNNATFEEAIAIAAEAYGIQPDYSSSTEEQRRKFEQRRTDKAAMQLLAKVVCAALQGNTSEAEAVRQYIAGRGLQVSERMGLYSGTIRRQCIAALQQKWGSLSVNEAEAMLRRYMPTIRKDYTNTPAGEWKDFADAYGLILPYFNGTGNVAGFCMRQTAAATYRTEDGTTAEMPKYLYSKDMPKGGYCDTLSSKDTCYMVEGLLDAEAMKQAGYSNVIALGGMTPTANAEDEARSQIGTLQRYGIKHLCYVPDLEYNTDGSEKTDATHRTIEALRPYLTGRTGGKGFISLTIVKLPNPDRKAKQDAASVLQEQGSTAMDIATANALQWYVWELQQAVVQNRGSREDMAAAAVEAYSNIENPVERQLIRRALIDATDSSIFGILREAGVTAAALSMVDKNGAASTYRSRIAEAVANLNTAVEKKATAETIGKLLNTAQHIQTKTEAAGFAAQVNATQAQLHTLVAQKPDYLETNWKLWKWNSGTGRAYESRRIGFAPANISIIGAPTTHGKTLFMLQAAMHLAQKTCKHFLYISLENDAEQLYIRALTAYVGGRHGSNWGSNAKGNLRKEVRDYIKGNDLPTELFETNGRRIDLGEEVAAYWRNVAPFLHFVRSGSGCDELCSNIAAQVEEWQNAGEQVGGIFLDYIQLLHLTGRAYSRTDEMKTICDNLNDLAKATGLPIICGSQMNREATKAGANGVTLDGIDLNNLGESSGIENIAEDCYLLYNTDRVNIQDYCSKDGDNFKIGAAKKRSKRLFTPEGQNPIMYTPEAKDLRKGCIYVECLKGREHETGSYCILPADFATGAMPTDENSAQK